MTHPRDDRGGIQGRPVPPVPKDLGPIVGRLSHDLKAPVRAITELADWIDEEFDEGEATDPKIMRDYISLLKCRGQRLATLVNSLTIFARVGLSDATFDGDWDTLMHRVSSALPALEHFNIVSDFQATPGIAQQDLFVLFETLLSNAAKHHHLGRGTIWVSSHLDDDSCVLKIQDDGPGIPPDQLDHAMEIFNSLRNKDAVEGSGLGLTIACRVVSHYGGRLMLSDPENGIGCEARASFPIGNF